MLKAWQPLMFLLTASMVITASALANASEPLKADTEVTAADGKTDSETGTQKAEPKSDADGSNESVKQKSSASVYTRIVIIGPDGKRREVSLNEVQSDDAESTEDDDSDQEEKQEKPVQERLMIGVHCAEADELLRGHLKLGETGLVVLDVVPESPSALVGIRKNDLLLKCAGEDLQTVQDLLDAVKSAGEKELTVELLRQGDPLTVSVTPKMLKEPQEVVITVSGSTDANIDGIFQGGVGNEDMTAAIKKWMEYQGNLRLLQIPPGIVINKSSSPDYIRRLIEDAAQAAGRTSPQNADSESGSQSTVQELKDQIDELQIQLKQLSDRLSKLEQPD